MLLRTLMATTLAAGLAIGFANAASIKGGSNNSSAQNHKSDKSEFCSGDVRGDIPKGFSQCEAGHEMGRTYIVPSHRHYNAY